MKKFLLTAVSVSALTACSGYDSLNATEKWKRYHDDSIRAIKLHDDQAIAVFYRTEQFDGEGVNVYVNGDYQASLLERSYSPVAVCANNPHFSASLISRKQFGNRTQGVNYDLTAGAVNYFKLVQNAKGEYTFEVVEEAQAKADLETLKGEVRHTLPRVVTKQRCETVKSEIIENTDKTLAAHALWGVNKYSYQDMLPEGKKEIAELAEWIKQNPSVSQIEISGFTDPEASAAYNLTLSQRRADAISQALKEAGVNQPIKAVGYGETRLIVADCAVKHKKSKARAACNKVNRRVEISIHTK